MKLTIVIFCVIIAIIPKHVSQNIDANLRLNYHQFNIHNEEVQSALKIIRHDMIIYTLKQIIVDLLEELYILTHHRNVQFKSSDIFEIIHVIEHSELKLVDLKLMREQMLAFITKHPDVLNMKHLRNHIIVDYDKVVKYLQAEFEKFTRDLEKLKTGNSVFLRMQQFLDKDKKTPSAMTIFYFWFEGILNSNNTIVGNKKLREILLKRIKIERMVWQLNNQTGSTDTDELPVWVK